MEETFLCGRKLVYSTGPGRGPWPPLLQVHKFINRNRGHLDPAVLEMLRQSQLQVT